VRKEMNLDLTRPLTLEEIQQAITSLPWGKAHGRDGIPRYFFQDIVQLMAPALL
jgi:hypothetical protein